MLYDMHTHSEHSHDSTCPVWEMAESIKEKGLSGFAVTDHCDIEFCHETDLDTIIQGSLADAGRLHALRGIEIGEGIWYPEVSRRILSTYSFDVVIGSVHAVRFPDYEIPFSRIDFGNMSENLILPYLDQYFDDMLSMIRIMDFDILAHITCPLRYINDRYHSDVTLDAFQEKIHVILKEITARKIALEVNTSRYAENPAAIEQDREILKAYRASGGELLTLGSDAHVSKNAANAFPEYLEMIKSCGFVSIYYYQNRRAILCEI